MPPGLFQESSHLGNSRKRAKQGHRAQ